MTVSYFEALERQIPALEARALLQSAQAAVYPHVSKEAAERMWRGWQQAAYPRPVTLADVRDSLLYLDGVPVTVAELRAGLGAALPEGLSA